MEEWTEVAWLESEGGPFKAELARTLDSFLSARGMSRNGIADHDIRVDLVYLDPAKGALRKAGAGPNGCSTG